MAASGDHRFSFQTGHKNSFGAIDYVIFAATLAVSASVGIFYAIKDRKRKNIKDFLLAGGNMHVVPVAMSLIATFMSAITMLGTPAEMYNYTTMYLYIGLGYLLCMAASAHIFVPIFYNLKLTSAYEVTATLGQTIAIFPNSALPRETIQQRNSNPRNKPFHSANGLVVLCCYILLK